MSLPTMSTVTNLVSQTTRTQHYWFNGWMFIILALEDPWTIQITGWLLWQLPIFTWIQSVGWTPLLRTWQHMNGHSMKRRPTDHKGIVIYCRANSKQETSQPPSQVLCLNWWKAGKRAMYAKPDPLNIDHSKNGKFLPTCFPPKVQLLWGFEVPETGSLSFLGTQSPWGGLKLQTQKTSCSYLGWGIHHITLQFPFITSGKWNQNCEVNWLREPGPFSSSKIGSRK